MTKLQPSPHCEWFTTLPNDFSPLQASILSLINSVDGTILLGVNPDGVQDILPTPRKEWTKQIQEWLNTFLSDLKHLVEIDAEATPFTIRVSKGANPPYYFRSDDTFNLQSICISENGCNRLATPQEIAHLLSLAQNSSYESRESYLQNLTFTALERYLISKKLTLKDLDWYLHTVSGAYNNLAYLLSDQNFTRAKVGTYTTLDDRQGTHSIQVFEGSLIEQITGALAYLPQHEHVVQRADATPQVSYNYPLEAIKEATINCFMHRNWYIRDDIRISVFPNRIFFYNPGGLPYDLKFADLQEGFYHPRNPLLAHLLHFLGLSKKQGTGFPLIHQAYAPYSSRVAPYHNTHGKFFNLTLYNVNYEHA